MLTKPVAAAAVLAVAVSALTLLVIHNRGLYLTQSDADIYRSAGRALWHSDGTLYGRTFGAVRMPFTYPPFAAVVFSAFAAAPFVAWQVLFGAVGAAALVGVIVWSFRLAQATPSWTAVFVLVAASLWLEPVDMTLFFGQVNLVLLALVVGDLAWSGRWSGVGVGLAAAVKLTPLVFVPYLWFTGRRRAAVTAAGVFAAAAAVTFVVRPRDSADFWRGRAFGADEPSTSVNQSLNGVAHRLFGSGSASTAAWVVASVLVGVAGLLIAVRASRRGWELAGVTACGAVGLLTSPISWTHHYVWVVAAAVLVTIGRAGWSRRGRVLFAAVTAAVFAWWPLPVGARGGFSGYWHPTGVLRATAHGAGRERHWDAVQFLTGDLYVWAAIAFVVYVGYATSNCSGIAAFWPDVTASAAPADPSS